MNFIVTTEILGNRDRERALRNHALLPNPGSIRALFI